MNRSEIGLMVVILTAGVVIPGVANYLLHRAGYSAYGSLAWVLGFGVAVLVVWWGWIRPLEFQPPGK